MSEDCPFRVTNVFIDERASYMAIPGTMHPSQPLAKASGAAFRGQATGERIEALLLAPADYRAISAGIATLLFLWLVQVVAITGLTHHLVESISLVGL